jgi:hypothetical protein
MRKDFFKIFFVIILSFFLTQFAAPIFFPPTFPKTLILHAQSSLLAFSNLSKIFSQKKPSPSSTSIFSRYGPTPFFTNPTVSVSPSSVFILPTKESMPTDRPKPTNHPSPTLRPSPLPSPSRISNPTPSPQINYSPLSSSKLGIFIIGRVTTAAQTILTACPKTIKIIDPQGNAASIQAIKDYKQNCRGGVAVLRFYNGTPGIKYGLGNNPEAAAEDFFQRAIAPNLSQLGNDKSFFDYLHTPNEFENTPEWWGKEKTQWNGRFWLKLTTLNKNAGIKTCIGGIPVGNTSGEDLQHIVGELRQMKDMEAAFCYHSYTFTYSTDPNVEIHLSLRYRQYYSFFSQNAPDLLSLPLIISEGGVAENGDPYAGYLKNNRIEDYKNWLNWFDQELKKDSYVIGVTLFQIGNSSDWGYFNLEPIGNWLADRIKNN